uniref:Putative tc1 transposase tc1-like transposase n=1 Tax=Ixodes ricinus TaxID=34613 RepID=A0A090XE40_IXORI
MGRVSLETRQQIIRLSKNGLSQRAIESLLGCARSSVRSAVKRYREDGTVDYRRAKKFKPRTTTDEEDRLIIAAVVDDPFLTSSGIKRELGLAASELTILRRLREAGLSCCNNNSRRLLTAKHREIRRRFATEYGDWTVDQWRGVVFTNESTVCCKWDKNRQAWKALHNWNDPLYNHQLAASGHTCLNLYAVVSYAGLGPLVRIEGSVTPDQCVDIIDTVVVPHLLDGPFQDGSFILQQDPSPTYTSETVTKHLEEQGILTMEWPPKSEDLNPMKGVWSIVKERICCKRFAEPSADLLWAMIKKEWDKLRHVPDRWLSDLMELLSDGAC